MRHSSVAVGIVRKTVSYLSHRHEVGQRIAHHLLAFVNDYFRSHRRLNVFNPIDLWYFPLQLFQRQLLINRTGVVSVGFRKRSLEIKY